MLLLFSQVLVSPEIPAILKKPPKQAREQTLKQKSTYAGCFYFLCFSLLFLDNAKVLFSSS